MDVDAGTQPDDMVDIAHASALSTVHPLLDPQCLIESIRLFGMRPLGEHLLAPTDLPTLLGARVPTIRHVPNAAQRDVSQGLAGVIQAYCAQKSLPALWQMLGFAKLILRPAPGRKKTSGEELTLLLRSRLDRLTKGDMAGLWQDVLAQYPTALQPRKSGEQRGGQSSKPGDGPLTQAQLDRVRQLLSEGAAKKALQLLNSVGVHDPSDASVWKTLEDLHPQPMEPLPPGLPPSLPSVFGDDAPGHWEPKITHAISHFPRGSAAGPSGLRPVHLQDAVKRRGGSVGLVAALGQLTKDWVHGKLPPQHGPALCAANLTPLRKADGGVRPVAVGDTLRRVVGKALLATNVCKTEVAQLGPIQTGIGIRGAAEAVAMGCQSLVDSLEKQPGWVLLKVDMSNAFNTVSRKAVLQSALQYCPSAFNFLKFAYSEPAPLFSGGRMLLSKEGTHQGCPLGPLGFALGIHPVLQQLSSAPGLHWQSWYLDDGLLLGDCAQMKATLRFLQDSMRARGLKLNLQKCELWGPGVGAWDGQDVKIIPWSPPNGITVLGVPVNYPGTTAYAQRFWDDLLGRLREATERLTGQIDPQCGHQLLRKCLDACKVTHLLRAADCYAHSSVEECDEIILGAFEDLLGCGLSEEQRVQASLPLRTGGCGLRIASRVRPAARISALASFYSEGAKAVGIPDYAAQPRAGWLMPPMTELRACLGSNFDPLSAWMGTLSSLTTAGQDHRKQKWWSEAIGKRVMQDLLGRPSVSARDQARLLEQANGLGSSFMSVPPNAALHTIIYPDDYRLALKWWLGLPLLELPQSARCPGCNQILDVFGDHLLCCRRNNYTKRHQAVQEALVSCLVECGQGAEKERALPTDCQPAGRQLRPADIFIPNWEGGHAVAIDLTISHGWSLSEQARGAPGELVSRERWRTFLCQREAAKHAMYDAWCQKAQWSFKAMAFGTWGGLGPECAKSLQRIVKRAAGWLEGDARASRQEEIRYAIGLTLMRQIWELLAAKNFV